MKEGKKNLSFIQMPELSSNLQFGGVTDINIYKNEWKLKFW